MRCRACPRLVAWREQVAARSAGVPRVDLLGKAGAELRRPAARLVIVGLAPGGPRREPHRPHVHGRSLGRLPLRGAAPCGLRQPAHSRRGTTGWCCADAYIVAPVRCAPPANKPTPRDRALRALPRARAGAAAVACGRGARSVRAPRPGRRARRYARGHASGTAWRWRSPTVGALLCGYHVSQQKHLHRPPHPRDVRRGAGPGPRAGREPRCAGDRGLLTCVSAGRSRPGAPPCMGGSAESDPTFACASEMSRMTQDSGSDTIHDGVVFPWKGIL